jgi:hypothetical protein
VCVAETASTTAGHDNALSMPRKIGDELTSLINTGNRSNRDFEHDIGTNGAIPTAAHPVRSSLSLEVTLVMEVDQRGHSLISLEDDAPTPATVAAIGTAFGHVLLTAERAASSAAVPSVHVYLRFIDEHVIS